MKKIMHYYTTPDNSGGPMTYISTIINADIMKEKYEFSVCYQIKTVKEIRIKDFIRIFKEIRKESPDILHIHGLQSEGFIGVLMGRFAKVPNILMTVHGMNHEATVISKWKAFLFRRIIEPWSLRHSDYVYCVAKSAEKKPIIQKNSRKLLPCIQNAVQYTQGADVDTETIGIQKDDIVVIIVGRVSIDKGMLTLEKVINGCKNERIKFLIVGEGDYSYEMQQKYAGNRRVIFTGFSNNPCGYLNIADIYLCVSLHENMSIALLEAGQHELPCIVTDVGDNADVVKNGTNGYVVAVDDHVSICNYINELTDHDLLRKHMGEAAKEIIEDKYSFINMINKIDETYRIILNDR